MKGRVVHRATFLMLALLSALSIASPADAALQPPYFQLFDVDIAIQPNGDFVVTETQTVVFGSQSARHGFRRIPMDRTEAIEDVTVSEPDTQLSASRRPIWPPDPA